MHVGCSAGIIGAANLVPPLITVLESEAVDGWSSVGFAFNFGSQRLFQFLNRRWNRERFCTFCLCAER